MHRLTPLLLLVCACLVAVVEGVGCARAGWSGSGDGCAPDPARPLLPGRYSLRIDCDAVRIDDVAYTLRRRGTGELVLHPSGTTLHRGVNRAGTWWLYVHGAVGARVDVTVRRARGARTHVPRHAPEKRVPMWILVAADPFMRTDGALGRGEVAEGVRFSRQTAR